MEMIESLFTVFLHYLSEVWVYLLIGFLLSGFIKQFIPTQFIEKHLGSKGLKPIAVTCFIGVLLPVCCIGSLPIAVTLQKKGARLGAVMAFLVATPATSLSALLVSLKLLGFGFTVYLFFSVIIIGMSLGIICDGINFESNKSSKHDCCSGQNEHRTNTNISRVREALRYAFIQMPKEMGFEITIGLLVASFITVYTPIHGFIENYIVGLMGYGFILVVGLLTYVCSTASVPLADALLTIGISPGQALCYLIVGPITSIATLMVIKKDFGGHILLIYLATISILAMFTGIVFDLYFSIK